MGGWIQGWGGFWTWLGPGPRPAVSPGDAPPVEVAPTSPPFKPAFVDPTPTLDLVQVVGGVSAVINRTPLNRYYFATDDTAEIVRGKLGGLAIVKQEFGGVGGGFQCSTLENHIIFRGGVNINAGILASYWDRNPEDRFPGVALSLAQAVVNQQMVER